MAIAWGITDGSAGMAAQVRALAQALGVELELKRVRVRKPFVWLPNACFANPLTGCLLGALVQSGSDSIQGPYPDMVISCGRRAAIVAMGLRARAKDTRFIHIQDPQVAASYFDVVVAMAHDRIEGPNVLKTRFALHAITPEILAKARGEFTRQFQVFPKPHIAVLLGGSTNKYRFTDAAMSEVIAELQGMLARSEGSLLITPSRRTGAANVARLKAAFAGNPRVYIYDGQGENPYMGLLACANYIVVSNDSVNMMSEAHATAKPLYLLPLLGHSASKPARFADALLAEGTARLAGEELESWSYETGDEMAQLAEKLKLLLPRK